MHLKSILDLEMPYRIQCHDICFMLNYQAYSSDGGEGKNERGT